MLVSENEGEINMFKILEKRSLNPSMTLMVIEAPYVAKKAKAGQFIILRVNEKGERIPLTIAAHDGELGTVTIIFQLVGKTTIMLNQLNVGDSILDFTGPLGRPSELEGHQRVAVVGGGAGCAIAYPQAYALHQMGAEVDIIAGFRNTDLIILEEEMRAASEHLYIMTDDGSNGHKGFVTNALQENLDRGVVYDLVVAIGPLPMMRAVCDITKKAGIKTIISMNSIMIDGTGMCGCCRLTVGGKIKFACVDGPDFNGHEVDFDEAIKRGITYKKREIEEAEEYKCRLMEGVDYGN